MSDWLAVDNIFNYVGQLWDYVKKSCIMLLQAFPIRIHVKKFSIFKFRILRPQHLVLETKVVFFFSCPQSVPKSALYTPRKDFYMLILKWGSGVKIEVPSFILNYKYWKLLLGNINMIIISCLQLGAAEADRFCKRFQHVHKKLVWSWSYKQFIYIY